MSFRNLILACIVAIAAPVGAAQALTLNIWDYDELQASDDFVELQFGTFDGMTTITLQWVGGADDTDTPGAIGIDKLFINNDSALEVEAVYANSIVATNDVTGAWLPTSGGTEAGGDFGLFIEKVTEPSGDGGIDPNTLIFVLDGLYDPTSFVANSNGASFAVHVRYGNDCSGWVADGGTAGASGSDANCGGNPVPEPSAALAFGAGALVVGSTLRRRRR